MIPFLVIGALAIAGAVVVSVFWNEIKDFIVASAERIKTVIIPSAIVGFRTYLEAGGNLFLTAKDTIKALQKYYTQNTKGQWQETVVTRTIPAKDIPEDIKRKLDGSHTQVDITSEVQQELHLEV
ncbi:hypothetical protein [Moraxella marmotae]|uniref:hypothetical protein n=1 Tax=Moraxella marmotae TaxID=3344520 RepID=UPI0035F301AA